MVLGLLLHLGSSDHVWGSSWAGLLMAFNWHLSVASLQGKEMIDL